MKYEFAQSFQKTAEKGKMEGNMQYINACECYSEPLDLWNDDVYRENTRMSKEEQCLILEMLKRKRPSRILEVGVFAGGGTAMILHCMNLLGLDAQLISVDLAENLGDEEVGYLVDRVVPEMKPAGRSMWVVRLPARLRKLPRAER